MYIVFYNLKRLFKWIFNTTNRKWRDRTNGKNVGKVKIRIFCIDVIYGVDGMWGGGGGGVEGGGAGGSQVNIQRVLSFTHFEL